LIFVKKEAAPRHFRQQQQQSSMILISISPEFPRTPRDLGTSGGVGSGI
jgi:hypothetical protein